MAVEKKGEEIIINTEKTEKGVDTTELSIDVIGMLAGIAAGEVSGIFGMSGGIVGGIAEKLGRKDLTRGIKINLDDTNIAVDLYVIVDYGVNIVEVCQNLRNVIRETLESTTGLNVTEVNIHVHGVVIPSEKEVEEEEEQNEENEQ